MDLRKGTDLQAVFDQCYQFMGVLAPDGVVLEANRAALAFIGSSREAVLGRPMWDTPWFAHDPVQRENLRQAVRRAAAGEFVRIETSHRSAAGEVRVFDFSLTPVRDAQGAVAWLIPEGRDVTGRIEAARSVAGNEAKFRLLFERSVDAILLLDGDRFIDCNPATLLMMRCSEQEFLRLHPWDLSPPFQPDGRRSDAKAREMIRLAHDRGAHRFEWMHRRPDGSDFPVEVTLIPIPLAGRDVLYTTWRDISEWVRAREELRRGEERFRAVAQHTGQLVYDWDIASGRIVWVGAIEAITGEKPEDFAGVGIAAWEERLHPDDRERTVQALERAQELVTGFNCEYRFRHRDGTYRHIEERGTFESGRDGAAARMLGVMSDITHRREAEEALWQAQKLESLGVLAGGIAHDFNNLLTAIVGNLNLAQLAVAADDASVPYLVSAESAVLKAAELTRQLLAYSGRGRFVVKAQSLNQVVREMTPLIQVSISKRIDLRYELAEELPALEADTAQLQQVILNLVTNAAEAIGDADGSIRIATGTVRLGAAAARARFPNQDLRPGRFVVLEVADTGTGMTDDVLARIFDPFFTTKTAGRGLGLSAMRGILRGHKGGISIETAPGRGSAFSLYFPASEAAAEPAREPLRPSARRRTGTVLLVDDEPLVLESARHALARAGFTVLTAVDGADAVAVFTENADVIRLVLMDLTMPRLDGRQAFQAIRALRPGVPILLSSGYSERDSLRDLLGAGNVGFLAKPYALVEMERTVDELLGGTGGAD